MKAQFRYAIHLLLAAMIATMVGCTSDDDNVTKQDMPTDGYVRLHLRVAGENLTRADEWKDTPNATDDEMMNIWVVVVINTADGSVEKVIACRPPEGHAENNNREIDEVGEIVQGNYTVYSFANISVNNVCSLLGLTAPATVPTIGNTPVEIEGVTGEVEAAADKTATINGNLFVPTAADNGYGEKGIPMSNVQTIAETDRTKDLIVVRMLAKIEVQVFNDGDTDATIHSISLTDITPNADDNLKLLPRWTNTDTQGPDSMPVTEHGGLQPNLGTGATPTDNMTYSPATGAGYVAHTGHKSTDETKDPVKFTFYVNESSAPINNASATLGNGTGLFYLSLGIKTGTGEDVVYTHALINQSGSTTTDDNAWHYIARNDYRVIPVYLTDWLFRVEPLAFVPIAGYPAVMLSSDAQKATFSTGGMIALQPFVKKRIEDTWRDFDDPEVTYSTEVMDSEDNTKVDEEASWNASITWTNANGTKVSGTDKIIKTPFVYDKATRCFIGELNNTLTGGPHKTAVTITVKLGTDPQYTYSFTCDVILDKRN